MNRKMRSILFVVSTCAVLSSVWQQCTLLVSSFRPGVTMDIIRHAESVITDVNSSISELSKPKYSHADQRFTPEEMYQLEPKTWRQWLSSHSLGGIHKLRKASLYTKGCGISMKVDFRSHTTTSTLPSSKPKAKPQHSAYFKHSTTDMSHYDAESHLRESKAYYLDRLLGTNVVLPCVGHVLPRDPLNSLLTHEQQGYVEKHMKCASRDDGIDGSLMLWLDGIKQVPHQKIIETALIPRKTTTSSSALQYALFHYVGGCMKSDHNHFYYKHPKKRTIQFTAIDNDRCFTPEAISLNQTTVPQYHRERLRQWERMLFQKKSTGVLCQNPVAQRLLLSSQQALLWSRRLQTELAQDALATQLLASQPEALKEIDTRVETLVEYLRKTCGDNATVTI